MRCEEFLALLDREGAAAGELGGEHVTGCPSCAAALARWRAVAAEFAAMAEEPPPPFLHARVMAHVRSRTVRRTSPAWWGRLRVGHALAVVLAVTLGGALLWHLSVEEPIQTVAEVPKKEGGAEPGGGGSSLADEAHDKGGARGGADRMEAAERVAPASREQLSVPPRAVGVPPSPASVVRARSAQAPSPAVAEVRERVASAPVEGESVDQDRERVRPSTSRAKSRAPVSSAANAPSAHLAAASRIEVDCVVRTEGGDEVGRLAVAEGDAPTVGARWLVEVSESGGLELVDPELRGTGQRARLERTLRSLMLPPGRYAMSRLQE